MKKQPTASATLTDYLKAAPLYLLPQHLLSRMMLALTRVQWPAFKNVHIKWFARHFNINMHEAVEESLTAYPTFNQFFTRALKADARPIVAGKNQLACPVDGTVSQAGPIVNGLIYQAKGHDYTLKTLLGGDDILSETFKGGSFATLYLSPRDYHRIHMSCDATLQQMLHIPGRLFSVNDPSVKVIPGLFARNERVVAVYDTVYGPMAMVLVGAIFVGSIETVWHGVVTPPSRHNVKSWRYDQGDSATPVFTRGQEMGRFNMGSTVIMLFANPEVKLDPAIQTGNPVRLGQLLAEQQVSASGPGKTAVLD